MKYRRRRLGDPEDHYYTLRNERILHALARSREQQRATYELAQVFIGVVDCVVNKPALRRLPFYDDLRAEALKDLVSTWSHFDPEKSNNPYAYFSLCAKSSVLQVMARERRQEQISTGRE